MLKEFLLRGIVEGFYGPPWSHAARLDVLAFVADRDMNAYVYAPKDDVKHRAGWREPYDRAEFERFRELIAHSKEHGITFGFAISPGLDIDYASEKDRAALLEKLRPFAAAGVSWFLLMLDDIPTAPGLATRQVAVTTWLHDALRREHGDAALALCPTEYVGTGPSPYLFTLADELPPDVDIMWTGPTVCSPTITAADAQARTAAAGGRFPLIWDNYPVNDGTMASSLHLGPYRGREAALVDATHGILCNPMPHAYASKVALATAADFLHDPYGYDPTVSWHRAIADVGGARAAPLRVLAEACAAGPLCEAEELELGRHVDLLRAELGGPGWVEAVRNTAEILRATKGARDDLVAGSDDPLVAEVAPWAAAAALEADAGLAALRLLQQVRPVATVIDGVGRAAGVDAEAAMHAAFGVMFAWSGARTDALVAFGARFALYPAVVQLRDGSPGVDIDAAVREDANVVDALCRLALTDYEAWRRAPTSELRAYVDGEPRTVDAAGAFDGRGDTVLVRDECNATRVATGERLPFRDARLSAP